jgi:hypothetical protein
VREREKNDKQRNAPASERARERENNSTASDRGGLLLLHTHKKKNAKQLTFERRFAERQQWGGEPRPREKERERKRKPESDD